MPSLAEMQNERATLERRLIQLRDDIEARVKRERRSILIQALDVAAELTVYAIGPRGKPATHVVVRTRKSWNLIGHDPQSAASPEMSLMDTPALVDLIMRIKDYEVRQMSRASAKVASSLDEC